MKSKKKKGFLLNFSIVILVLLSIFLINENIKSYKTFNVLAKNEKQNNLSILNEKEKILQTEENILEIQTSRGQEKEVVEKFNGVKEGEKIIILTD